MKRIVLAGLALFFVFGCKSIKEGFNEGFTQGWRESFVESCTKDNDSQEQKDLCTCCADKAIEQLTLKQLSDAKYASDYIIKNIVPECQGQDSASSE